MEISPVFKETYHKYLSQLKDINLPSVTEKLGAELEGDSIIIPYYRIPLRVSTDGIFDKNGNHADFSVSVVLFQYVFHCPTEVPIAGDWVTFRDFRDSGPLGTYFTANNNNLLETTFEGNLGALKDACKRMGGVFDDDPTWELSVTFYMLPRIPVRLRFNDKDDEFPAQSSILFRQSAESYINMESLAIGVTDLTNQLP